MFARLTATLAATAIAVTSLGATPAAADDRDAARIAAAVLGVAIIGKILHDKNKRDRAREAQQREVSRGVISHHHVYPESVYRPVARTDRTEPASAEVWDNPVELPPRPGERREPVLVEPLPLPDAVARKDRENLADLKELPQQCFRGYDTRAGSVFMFGSRCLEDNYSFTSRLPQHCAQQVRTDQGEESGFDARCLRSEGYSLARG